MATNNRRGVVLAVGWHDFEVVSYRSEISKAGDSTNYIFELVCRDDNEGSCGVHITQRFNSKAKGYLDAFLEALRSHRVPLSVLTLVSTPAFSRRRSNR